LQTDALPAERVCIVARGVAAVAGILTGRGAIPLP
jgi:hypothetical protein